MRPGNHTASITVSSPTVTPPATISVSLTVSTDEELPRQRWDPRWTVTGVSGITATYLKEPTPSRYS
jgi:hypothetical protein